MEPGAQQPTANTSNPLANYRFTNEELQVLKECNRESFYFRSLPFGTVLGTAAYYAVKGGYLKPSAKLGAIPKVLIAVGVGYFAGKIAYQDTCMEKIMALPNSKLAEVLRQRKGRGTSTFQDSFALETSLNTAAPAAEESSQRSESLQEMRALDLSFDAPPAAAGLDDSSRPTMYSTGYADDALLPAAQASPSTTSYEELRQRNRLEYEQKRSASATGSPPPPPPPSMAPAPVYREEAAPAPMRPAARPAKTNKYGDVWDE